MVGDFLLLNSDTRFSLPVLQALLASPAAPVSLAVDHKERYDDDDMKVELDGSRLLDIGKKLPPERVQGESIGMLYFRGEGPRRFVAALDAAMLDPAAIRQRSEEHTSELQSLMRISYAGLGLNKNKKK